MVSDLSDLSRIPEVAERLRLGRSTVYRLVREGQLASVRIGSRVLVTERALIDFIAEREGNHASA